MAWKPVEGYEGLYEVSDTGQVKNAITGLCLKQAQTANGYCRVKLYRHENSKRVNKTFMVHRLVAAAFIGKADAGMQVNHIDGNKKNNAVSNLEWCTQSENLAHSVRIGLRDMSCCTNATKKKVMQIGIDDEPIKVWDSMSDAARALNLRVENISHCCAGRIKQTGGYKWNFVI